jgi:hypothetical protein
MSNSNINTCNAGNVTDEGRVSCCPNSSSSSCGAANNKNNIADSRFSCNICFDAVAEPVVTRCGHLYCWPCLFRWLEPGMLPEERQSLGMSYVYNNNNRDVINRRECPVCKSECSLSSLVPVYVRSSIRDDDDDDDDDDDKDEKSLKNKNNKLGRTAIDDDKKISVRNGNSSDTNDDELDSGDGDGDEGDDSFINETPENGIGIDLDESLPVTNNGSSSDDGLRRRRNTNNNNNNNNNAVVPNRPSATNSPQQQPSSPVISSANNNNNNNNNNSPPPSSSHSRSNGWITPRSPNGHNASLTHGILLSFQRATAEYYRNSNNHNTIHSNQYDQNQQQIPSLHDRRNPSSRNNNNNNNGDATSSAGIFQEGQQQVDVNSETTQYLSRLLIMLTSFVILCLLLV